MAGGRAKEYDLFNALGHPMRRRILRAMLDMSEEISPGELALKLSEQLSALSYHVRVLAECKAIELVRAERVHGSTQHFYRPRVRANWVLSALEAGEGSPPSAKRRPSGG